MDSRSSLSSHSTGRCCNQDGNHGRRRLPHRRHDVGEGIPAQSRISVVYYVSPACIVWMIQNHIQRAGLWQWRESISVSITHKSKGWLRIRPPARDMRGLYIKRTDGLRCHARPVERIAGPDAKILTYHQKSSGAGHRKW